MKEFHGRVIAPGTFKGEAAVTHGGFNTLASFQKSALNSRCKKIQTVASRGIAPLAWLFSEPIDPLAASGIILATTWNGVKLVAVDNLGPDFLDAVKTGDQVEVKEDGTVIVY